MGRFIPVDPDRWAELVKAAGERDALVVEVRRLDAEVTDLKSTADRFKAEVERMTKTADLICRMSGDNQVIKSYWKHAKKGVQS